jgi:hypothetical protein
MLVNKLSLPRSGEQSGHPGMVNLARSSSQSRSQPTTLDMLCVGGRVCVRGRPHTCGEVVRLIPMTGRVIVRLDPPHPAWRGTLRSFRPERLLICDMAAEIGAPGLAPPHSKLKLTLRGTGRRSPVKIICSALVSQGKIK